MTTPSKEAMELAYGWRDLLGQASRECIAIQIDAFAARAVAAEREACAKIAESYANDLAGWTMVSDDIRARGDGGK